MRVLEHCQPQYQVQLEFLQETIATITRDAAAVATAAIKGAHDSDEESDEKGGKKVHNKERFLANRLAMRCGDV